MEEHVGTLMMAYDRDGDVLWLCTAPPYPAQLSEEIDDGVIARKHPHSGDIEGMEILFFGNRFADGWELRVPMPVRRTGTGA